MCFGVRKTVDDTGDFAQFTQMLKQLVPEALEKTTFGDKALRFLGWDRVRVRNSLGVGAHSWRPSRTRGPPPQRAPRGV